MLTTEAWRQVPHLLTGERSGLFAMRDDLYGCYLRVGVPGPWAGPWAGIVRLEVPAGVGRALAKETADAAAGWLPAFASAHHRDRRAPVNMAPVAALNATCTACRAIRGWRYVPYARQSWNSTVHPECTAKDQMSDEFKTV